MTNELTTTTAAVLIPEIWSQEMVDYMYAAPVVMNRVHRVDREIVARGSKINLPIMPAISVNDVSTSDGSVTNQALTQTETELSISYHREATVSLLLKADIQANRDILADFKRQFPDVLMQDIEDKLLALHSSVTTNAVGDTNSVPGEDLLTAAVSKLLDSNFGIAMRDPNRVTWFFHTNQWQYLKKVDGWNDAEKTGASIGGGVQLQLPSVYGIPLLLSSRVANSSGRRNLLCLREALALGIQNGIDIVELPSTALAKTICAHVLYGVAAYNEARAVKITTVTA